MSVSLEKTLLGIQEIIVGLKDAGNRIEPSVMRSICAGLHQSIIAIGKTEQPSTLSSSQNLQVLEDLCSAKNLIMSKVMQGLIQQIYELLLISAPGFAVRNVVTSMLNIFNGKTTHASVRECVLSVIGETMKSRSFDCGSLINDIILAITKLLKATSETSQKVACLKSLCFLMTGGGIKIQDTHSDIFKSLSKFVVDKAAAEIRITCAQLIEAIVRSSSGCTSISSETFLSLTSKCLEDENPLAQDAFIRAVAAVYYEQIVAFHEAQEQAKIGLARGGSGDSEADKKASPIKKTLSQRMSITKLTSSVVGTQKKAVEDYDFKSVLNHLVKQLLRPQNTSTHRIAYLSVIGHVVKEALPLVEDMEFLIASIINILHESVITALSYEEIVFFRVRLSSIIRTCIAHNLNESGQISLATTIAQYIANVETRTEQELQLALTELNHLVISLGEAAISIFDDIHATIPVNLRHSGFGVRQAAANVMASLARITPATAARFIATALTNAQTQVRLLTNFETVTADPSVISPAEGEYPNSNTPRSSQKETELMTRMYCFHGHILVISILLKDIKLLPTGIPVEKILEIFDFGLSLLGRDILSSPPAFRHVSCSIIRAGSLVVSSCLNSGYTVMRPKLPQLLQTCHMIISAANSSSPVQDDEMLFELMVVEAALVCISTLIWFIPEALYLDTAMNNLDPNAGSLIDVVVENLDTAFRAIKAKYQPKFRSHFRFRTLHVILLECFAWLPPNSFPQCSQQVFVEALRVFRDCISSGAECTCLAEVISDPLYLLSSVRVGTSPSASGTVFDIETYVRVEEGVFMLRLETNAIALPKKESEAFLAIFGKSNSSSSNTDSSSISNNNTATGNFLRGVKWQSPTAPCAQIDSRTTDASIKLIASTFSSQTDEYQEKAIQLLSQAITQFVKSAGPSPAPSSTMTLFSSSSASLEEEKRRKGKKNFITIKNVIAAFCCIMKSLPSYADLPDGYQYAWIQVVLDRLTEMLSYTNSNEIKIATCFSITTLISKIQRGSSDIATEEIVDSLYSKVCATMVTGVEKPPSNTASAMTTNNLMAEFCGHILVLGGLCCNAHSLCAHELRDKILLTLIESLRRVDTSIAFRSYGMVALLQITQFFSDQYRQTIQNPGSGNNESIEKILMYLIENAISIVDINSCNITNCGGDEFDQFQTYSVRLIGVIAPALSALVESSTNDSSPPSPQQQTSPVRKKTISSVTRIWDTLYRSSKYFKFRQDCIQTLHPLLSLVIQVESISSSLSCLSGKDFSIICRDVVSRRAEYPLPSIQAVVDAIQLLILDDSASACENELDVALFELLDWTIATSSVPVASAFAGLEITAHAKPESTDSAKYNLQHSIQSAIVLLVKTDVFHFPNKRGAFWILFAKALALGQRVSESNEGDNMDDEAAGGTAATNHSSNGSHHKQMTNASTASAISYQELTTIVRNSSVDRVAKIPASRLGVKVLSISLANIALSHHSLSHPAHRNLAIARSDANSWVADPTAVETSYNSVPPVCFASLFLHDIINLACAGALFTVNEKRFLSLQKESILFLQTIVVFFQHSVDPDVQDTSGTEQGFRGILNQFVSQLLSAIRPSLAEQFCPLLALTATSLIKALIEGGYLNDKVVVRRLVKTILNYSLYGSADPEKTNAVMITARARISEEVSENVSFAEHLVGASNAAQLFFLTVSEGKTSSVRLGKSVAVELLVRQSIKSMVQENLDVLTEVWVSISKDALRALSLSPAELDATELRQTGHYDSSGVSEDMPLALLPFPLPAELDRRRGGITFSSHVNPNSVEGYFQSISIYTLLAAAASPSLPATEHAAVFAMIQVYLKHLDFESDQLTQQRQRIDLLIATSALAKVVDQHSVPPLEWASFLSSWSDNVQLINTAELRSSLPILQAIADILHVLLSREFARSSLKLASWIWTLSNQIILLIFPDYLVVPAESTSSSSVISLLHGQPVKPCMSSSPEEIKALTFRLNTLGASHASNLVITLIDVLSLATASTVLSGSTRRDISIDDSCKLSRQQNHEFVNTGVNILLGLLGRIAVAWPGTDPSITLGSPIVQVIINGLKKIADELERRTEILQQICAGLMMCLHSWQRELYPRKSSSMGQLAATPNLESFDADFGDFEAHFDDSAATAATTTVAMASPLQSSAALVTSLVEILISVWIQMSELLIDIALVPEPLPVISIIIASSTAGEDQIVGLAILNKLLKLLQSDLSRHGPFITNSFLPAIISTAIQAEKIADFPIDLPIAQMIFVLFSLVPEAQRSNYVGLILPPICGILAKSPALETPATQFSGRGLTRLARSCPEALRDHIGALNDNQKVVLQSSMRIALQQEAAQESQQAANQNNGISSSIGAGAALAPIKKIDMNRYKK